MLQLHQIPQTNELQNIKHRPLNTRSAPASNAVNNLDIQGKPRNHSNGPACALAMGGASQLAALSTLKACYLNCSASGCHTLPARLAKAIYHSCLLIVTCFAGVTRLEIMSPS